MKISANIAVKPVNISLDGLFAQKVVVAEGGVAEVAFSKEVGTLLVSSPDCYVEQIYFNTNLSIDQVKEICQSLTYLPTEPAMYVAFLGAAMIAIVCQDNEYTIMSEDEVFFNSAGVLGGLDFDGWNPNINHPLIIQSVGMDNWNDTQIGAENDKLTRLFSMNNDFQVVESTKTLEGTYQGNDITLSLDGDFTINLEQYLTEGKLPLHIHIKKDN